MDVAVGGGTRTEQHRLEISDLRTRIPSLVVVMVREDGRTTHWTYIHILVRLSFFTVVSS